MKLLVLVHATEGKKVLDIPSAKELTAASEVLATIRPGATPPNKPLQTQR